NRLLAEVQSDDNATASAAPTPGVSGLAALAGAATGSAPAASATPTPNLTPGPRDFTVARFWDTYVWYHKGGEEPGRYRLELYANGVLTDNFDYIVGTVPVPTPTSEVAQPAQPALDPSPSLPTIEDLAPAPPPPPP